MLIKAVITSVSVLLWNFTPSFSNSFFKEAAFSIIPLCTSVILPTWCGWAFFSLGSPWVAHLVWAIPILQSSSFSFFNFSSKKAILPTHLTIWISLPFLNAIPEESYPLYSRFFKPSNRISLGCSFPIYPIIPHIKFPPDF